MIIQINTPADTALWTTRLNEAIAAMHKIQTGKGSVSVSYNGENVSFNQTSIHKLSAYIGDIQKALGLVKKTRPSGRGISFG